MRKTERERPSFALEIGAGQGLAAGALICGVDEAGRGPLAGPVVAAAFCLLERDALSALEALGLDDSKKLTETARLALFQTLRELHACGVAAIGVGAASVAMIERLNILRANDLAMRRAVARLRPAPALALIDGNRAPPGLCCACRPVVKGDAKSLSIAAASILAKVTRDRIMRRLALRHLGYGWETNAGYPTAAHRAAILALGPTPHHRKGFAGVRS